MIIILLTDLKIFETKATILNKTRRYFIIHDHPKKIKGTYTSFIKCFFSPRIRVMVESEPESVPGTMGNRTAIWMGCCLRKEDKAEKIILENYSLN